MCLVARSRNDISFRFLGDTKSLDKASRSAQGSFKKTQGATDKLMGAMKGLVGIFAAREVAQFAGDAIKLAAAADEVDSKFDAVFGTSTRMNQALIDWGDIAGVTEADAKNLAATFGNLAQAQGVSATDTEELTLLVAELAGDMASFNDADPALVFNDLNKALLTTEREGMKKYGIALTETEIKQEALRIAAEDGRDSFTKADKALASYNLTVKQAGKAIGDLEKTQDSAANQQRQLTAEIEDMKTELGRQLLPVYGDFLKISKDLLPILSSGITEVGRLVGAYEGLRDITKIVSGNSDAGTGGFTDSLTKVAEVVSNLNPLIAATNGVLGILGKDKLSYASSAAGEFKMTMDEAHQAMWDAQGAAQAAASGVQEFGDAAASAEGKLKSLDDMARIFTGNLFDLAAAEQAANVNNLFAGGGGSGQVDDLVSASQKLSDITDLGNLFGG